jgi:hypothetical protein
MVILVLVANGSLYRKLIVLLEVHMSDPVENARKLVNEALQKGDFEAAARLVEAMKLWQEFQKEENAMKERRNGLLAMLTAKAPVGLPAPEHNSPGHQGPQGQLSPQRRGEVAREAYVSGLASQGISLRPVGRKQYATDSGLRVGIPYATELPHLPNAWFLGLAESSPDVVILVCLTSREKTLDFVLPPKLLKDIWTRLSRSSNQVKFHVTRAGATYELRVPGGRLESINQFLGAYDVLRKESNV